MRIVSGGQTGVDRAALDLARELGLDVGGWVPRGRLAEDGALPDCYPLTETPSANPSQRTEWNVRDSKATLIVSDGTLTGGSALTAQLAERLGRPWLHANLRERAPSELIDTITTWIVNGQFDVLNVAGPPLSIDPNVYAKARALLSPVFRRIGRKR
jgi:hypothetical protein